MVEEVLRRIKKRERKKERKSALCVKTILESRGSGNDKGGERTRRRHEAICYVMHMTHEMIPCAKLFLQHCSLLPDN